MSLASIGPRTDVRGGSVLRAGVFAGVAGGLAEILWVAGYQGGAQSAAVARGVTATVVPQAASSSSGVALGLTIHMTLAMLLGLAIAVLVQSCFPRIRHTFAETGLVVGLLVLVWAVNFLIILPAINPQFLAVIPLGAAFVSKMLFGVAAAIVFRLSNITTWRRHSNVE